MRGPRALSPALAAVVALAGVIVAAQLWPTGSPPSPSVSDESTPTWIEVIPHVESVMERGQAQQFRAVVHDRRGEPLPGAHVTWSLSRPNVGTIGATGLFVATTACLRWDAIGLVVAKTDAGVPGGRALSDGALVAIHHDPTCLPRVPASSGTAPGGAP